MKFEEASLSDKLHNEEMKKWIPYLRRTPAPALLIATVLCLALQENYPFSDFPMYSSFSSYSYYIYITDSQDNPIPIAEICSIRTSKLKKKYGDYLKDHRKKLEKEGVEIKGYQYMTLEQRRLPGEQTLAWLYEACREGAREELYSHRPLRFHQVQLKMQPDKTIRETHLMVAELP